MFFIWRETTEAAAESDDISWLIHPGFPHTRTHTHTFPAWKQTDTGMEWRVTLFIMMNTFQALYWLTINLKEG